MSNDDTQLESLSTARKVLLAGFTIVTVVAIGSLLHEGFRQNDRGAGYDLLNQKGIVP